MKGGTHIKISISEIYEKAKIYEKALSMFVVQKSMAILASFILP